MRSGENTIEARVFNNDAPPALWFVLVTDTYTWDSNAGWEASLTGSSWRNCTFAADPRKPGPGNLLYGGENVLQAIAKVWPPWMAFAVVAIVVGIAIKRWIGKSDTDLSHVQILILLGLCAALWLALFWNNTQLLPFISGYDSKDHLAYIKYIQERGALPLPNQGYEMFQPPLYYAMSAALLSVFHLSASDAGAVHALRALTMLFGIVNFIFVFLSVRLLFPRQAIGQLIGLITAAFLPMQLYLSHYVTNETLVATLASATIYLGLRALSLERVSVWSLVSLGACLGAAILTKATGLLLIPPLVGAFAIRLWQQRAAAADWLRTFGSSAGAALIVCGWHYLRVWRHFGSPIVGNWDPILGFPLWQDPGFHTAVDYLRFGQALISPMFSGFNGFADGIYSTLWGESLGGGLSGVLSRTPWNYNLMIGGYWLALLPTLLVIAGAVIASWRFVRQRSAEWFLMLGLAAAVVFALVFMTLKVPSYAQVKAFYGLVALVPFCALATLGWNAFVGYSRVLRFTLFVALIFSAINNYASVWIRRSPEQHIYGALRLSAQLQLDRALVEATEAARSDPANGSASYVLAAVLDETGESQKAISECEHCLQVNPDNGDCHFQLAVCLGKRGDLSSAIAEAGHALQLLPENPRAHDLALALNRERKGETIATARDALAVSPFDADLHYRVGLAAGQSGDFAMATTQFAYAVLLDPRKIDYEQKLRVALSFLQQSPDAIDTIRDLQPLAANSSKLLEILAPYRQDPNSTSQDHP
ncbi:MAG TPA: glycosyltransferase family 39 protein [Chthoniobacterales bacterium]|nr:glycosyltransferase family 39 protein [Chthoniobacterales bacterium]